MSVGLSLGVLLVMRAKDSVYIRFGLSCLVIILRVVVFFVAYLDINRVLGVPHDLASYAMGLPRRESVNGSEYLVVVRIGSGRSE